MRNFWQAGAIAGLSLFILCTACTPGMTKSEEPGIAAEPEDIMFTGEGAAADFPEARNNAYADVMKKAVIFLLGRETFDNNKEKIEQDMLSYAEARKYILGETGKAPQEKQKKWVSNLRNEEGMLVLRMDAYVNISKLKKDLSGMDLSVSTEVPAARVEEPAPQAVNSADLSSLTFLVFYNKNDPALEKDPDQETYAKWAVDDLDMELSSLNIKTFDPDTVEKLSRERTLLQESRDGVGVGLALAQKVYAELYAEVTPDVAYDGDKANAVLNVKVYIRTTGALVGTFEKGGQQYESSSLAASIRMSMREASKKIMEDLRNNLSDYIGGGRFYFIRLTGVKSFKEAGRFLSAVKTMDGVVDLTLRSGSKDDMIYDFNLRYKGTPTDAVDNIFNSLSDKEGFEKLDLKEIRGNELTFSIE